MCPCFFKKEEVKEVKKASVGEILAKVIVIAGALCAIFFAVSYIYKKYFACCCDCGCDCDDDGDWDCDDGCCDDGCCDDACCDCGCSADEEAAEESETPDAE